MIKGNIYRVKKGDDPFDITMGSFDGAECCDLVGLFLLSKLEHLPINVGAYRDDVLGACNLAPFQVEKVKQQVVEVFQEHGLKVKAAANATVVNFLDVTLDLTNEVHRPYIKPSTHLEYVHVNSNHPGHVTRHAVSETSKRLSLLSSNEVIFNNAKGPFEEALKRAGHKEKLAYQPAAEQNQPGRRRRREITWFNPPFCSSMTTKLGKVFLSLLDECFPVGHPLRRVFNRHTVQLSYRTMPNLARIIASNNSKLLKVVEGELPEQLPRNSNCNCRGGTVNCIMDGARCKDPKVKYQATVVEEGKPDQQYVGVTEPTFKLRYNNHTATFRHREKKINSALAGYVWKLKDEGREYSLKWRILQEHTTYNPTTNACRLCLSEKYTIMHQPELSSLNQRTEFYTPCFHKQNKLLDKT